VKIRRGRMRVKGRRATQTRRAPRTVPNATRARVVRARVEKLGRARRSGLADLLGHRDTDGNEDQQDEQLLHRKSPFGVGPAPQS